MSSHQRSLTGLYYNNSFILKEIAFRFELFLCAHDVLLVMCLIKLRCLIATSSSQVSGKALALICSVTWTCIYQATHRPDECLSIIFCLITDQKLHDYLWTPASTLHSHPIQTPNEPAYLSPPVFAHPAPVQAVQEAGGLAGLPFYGLSFLPGSFSWMRTGEQSAAQLRTHFILQQCCCAPR